MYCEFFIKKKKKMLCQFVKPPSDTLFRYLVLTLKLSSTLLLLMQSSQGLTSYKELVG
jgi:hypothetical protein